MLEGIASEGSQREKRVSELEQKFWQVLIRGYSLGMRFRFIFSWPLEPGNSFITG